MSYSVLYRRLRPTTFKELWGQEHIVKTLSNQIDTGRISHAYLFCGTRGTGKTTTAKLFSKAVNCEKPVNGEHCGECSFCRLPNEDLSAVIFEIDAASNNGVDNIRELRDEVGYLAPYGKYKVYIIDEVHMLSTGAFNALLKTLEEPPAHVVFILATTEPQKVPTTIHSRCQRFDFRRISTTEISSALSEYMIIEKVTAEKNALNYVAKAANGSMRDALSIIEQCLAFHHGEELTLAKVMEVLGAVDSLVLFELTDALYNRDGKTCIGIIGDVYAAGRDLLNFCEELVLHFRDLIVCLSAGANEQLFLSAGDTKDLEQQSKRLDISSLMNYVNVFSELHGSMKFSSNHRVLMEVACVKLTNTLSAGVSVDILERVASVEQRLDFISGRLIENRAFRPEASEKTLERGLEEQKPDVKAEISIEKQDKLPEQKDEEPKIEPKNNTTLETADVTGYVEELIKNWNNVILSMPDKRTQLFLKKTEPVYKHETVYILCDAVGILDFLISKEEEISKTLFKDRDIKLKVILRQDLTQF